MIDLTAPIRRDANKLAHTEHCREHPDGSLTLTVGQAEQLLEAADLAQGAPFARTLFRLMVKNWFEQEVMCDLTRVCAARWLVRPNGWS